MNEGLVDLLPVKPHAGLIGLLVDYLAAHGLCGGFIRCYARRRHGQNGRKKNSHFHPLKAPPRRKGLCRARQGSAMTDFARLVMSVDASGMIPGEQALDQLARTGDRVDGSIKGNTKSIERSMATLGNTIGGLGGTMKSLEAAITRSMGSAATETQRGARGFEDLRRTIDPAYAASQRFAVVQADLAAMVIEGTASQAQANQVLELARSRYLGVATAAEAAEQAQREQAAAVDAATANYQSMRAALDPLYASSKRYEQAIETANAALKAKIITEAEHARTLQMVQNRYLSLTPATAGTTAGLARFTPQITNASFQVQDFAVQVASGQSALTTFTQQFPQLAGALGVSGKLALVGAALGTVVAVGAALLPLFMSAASGARALEDAVGDLDDAMSAYRSAVDGVGMSADELTGKFGINASAARELYGVMRDLAELEFAKAMSAAVSAATGTFGDLGGQLARVNALSQATIGDTTRLSSAFGQLQGAVADLNSQYGMGYGQLVDLNRAMKALEDAKGPAEQARAAAEFVSQLRDAQDAGAQIPPVILQTANELARASMLGLELTGHSDNAASALRNAEAAARGLASALAAASGFSAGIENQITVIQSRIEAQKAGADAAIAGTMTSMRLEAAAARDRQVAAGMDRYNAEALYQLDIDRIEQLGEMTAQEQALAEAARESAKAGRKGASEAEKAAKQAAKAAEKNADALKNEAQQWRELLNPVAKYKRELADLAKLSGILSKDEMAEAQRRLNVELADSLPLAGELVDTMVDGLGKGFKDTLKDMGNLLKKWILEQIAFAAKNRIVMAMGMGGGMAGSMASAAVPGMAGAPGAGGAIGAGLGTVGSAAFAGASGFLSAAAGGFGSAATYTGFMLKGATTSLAGFGTALGAIALPLAAVVGVFSFFKKKTKELDAGLRVTVDGLDTLVQEFRKTETKRFWGLSKKVRTAYQDADKETQDSLSKVVGNLQAGIMDAAKVLGFGAATFRDFSHQLQISTKGMSDEDALKAVQDAIGGLGDEFAGMVPGLKGLRLDGEGASDALLRLSQSLVGVNGIMDALGHRFKAAGLSGANAAYKIAEAFGGLDAMAAATQRFYAAFYSDQERLATTTRQTRKAMAELGIAMPKTRNEYRAIIAALDLTTEKGRKAYAAMIGMSDAFDLILPKMGGFTKQMEKLQDKVETALGSVMEGLADAIKTNAAAAANWRKAGESIRAYLERLRGTASALISPQQALANNRAAFDRTVSQAQGGNVEAAQNLPGAAQAYLGSVMETARTREEAAMAQARVAAALGKVAFKTDATASALEKVAELQQKQVDLLQGVKDRLAAGEALTREGITSLLGKLGGLDARIALRAADAGTIVAGFGSALKGTKVQANVTATVTGIATITGAEGLQSAMSVLRGSLVDLRAAIAAETQRQREAVKKAADVINPAPKPATPAKPATPEKTGLDKYKFEKLPNGYVRATGPLGGTRTFGGMDHAKTYLKMANYPAFARGGQHQGGPAYIGEKDLELVAPSRIYSPTETKAMLDNREVVAELKALRAELAELQAHARRGTESAVQTEKTLKRIDALGVKIDPDQNKVTA